RRGARRGGRQGAREGAGVARPAAGAGGQAQVAGLLLGALAFGCANQGEPPGGPPRTTPAAILRTTPESGAVVPGFRGKAVVQFDEVIDEAPGSAGGGGTGAVTGTAVLWVEQRLLTQAVIRAAPLPDTAAYVTLTDSAGNFRLLGIPPGRYRVWAIQDQNNNRRQDRREPFDTVSVTVDSTANAVLWAFVHDTIGPRVRTIEPVDSFTLRTNFS